MKKINLTPEVEAYVDGLIYGYWVAVEEGDEQEAEAELEASEFGMYADLGEPEEEAMAMWPPTEYPERPTFYWYAPELTIYYFKYEGRWECSEGWMKYLCPDHGWVDRRYSQGGIEYLKCGCQVATYLERIDE